MAAARPCRGLSITASALSVVLLLALPPLGRCQDDDDYDDGSQGASRLFASVIYDRLKNLTGAFSTEITEELSFCITDADKEWSDAFNFSSDLTFLSKCAKETKALLCQIGVLRSFSLEKLQYWRERASGMSSLAYFLSRDTIDHFNTIIKPIVYLSVFYFFNNPRSSIWDNYIILVALVYCLTGGGYAFAIFFQPGSAQLWPALLPVILTLVATQQKTSKFIANLCYRKWALEACVIANAERYSGVWLTRKKWIRHC